MKTYFQIILGLLHCVLLPLLLLSGPIILVHLVLQCYSDTQVNTGQFIKHIIQIVGVGSDNINSNNNTDYATLNKTQIYDTSSLNNCEIYLVPLVFFAILCIFILLMFIRYRICTQFSCFRHNKEQCWKEYLLQIYGFYGDSSNTLRYNA